MKRVLHHALLLMLTLSATTAFSQNPTGKPSQFNNLPRQVNCSETEFERALSAPKGQTVSLAFSDNFVFTGEVISNIVKYGILQTILVKSPAYNNSLFSISRIINGDRSIKYVGRIINKKYADGFELKQDASGAYQLVKVQTDKVMPDCSHQ